MDARERNSGVIIPLSLIPGMISVHIQKDAVRAEDRDPPLRHVHSVVNLTREYVELVLVLTMAAESRDISDGTALRDMPG